MIKGKKLIGLTGAYCAGKNYLAPLFERRLIPVLDIDKLGHEIIEKEKDSLVRRFGEDILASGSDGNKIDRKKLGTKVFGKSEELAALEKIIHPGVNLQTFAWIDSTTARACVINAALLHRSDLFESLDALVIVEAPLLVRLLRARARDRLSWTSLLKRFGSQKGFDTQYLAGKTDIYRVKNPALFGLKKQIAALEKRIDEILSLQGIRER
jgi:dephospho-CoA kinase